jgi:adenylate cyclase
MAEKRVQRRLAAILAADVVGYSRLMGDDEEGTLAALTAHLTELIEPCIAEHRGRVVKTTGDGLLAEFASVVDAVRCEVVFQEGMAERNADTPDDRRFEFRIGINLGDVIVQDDDVFGDGVNVAARLEGLAEPGGITVSGTVHEHVSNKLDMTFDDLGEHKVKNVAKPVRIFRMRWSADASEAQTSTVLVGERPAVAVLPFTNMSGDSDQEYFSDGLTEEIITALSHWRSFPVIARNSTFTYKNKSVDIKQAGRELGARYLLEGSVRKSGRRIRITAQLIDGVSAHHIWAERYDREFDDIFEVQDEITQRITAIVAPELVKAETKRLTAKRPEDLNAWDYWLRGMARMRERTPEAIAKARELFQIAISIQPDYSDAHARLSYSYHLDILLEVTDDRMATATLAMEAARDAVKFDENSSIAHRALSTAYQWLNRHDEALREAKIAVEFNPNDASGLHALGNKSDLAGDSEGISRMEKAQRLNPQDAALHSHLTFLARAYLNIGAYEEALDRARRAIERSPDYPHGYYAMALALGHLGREGEGRAALSKSSGWQG